MSSSKSSPDSVRKSRAHDAPAAPRTQPEPPPAWKCALLIVLLAMLFWLAFYLRPGGSPPNVVYASRYSKEFKYRPAASPVITERLKDGRVRLRGALPT